MRRTIQFDSLDEVLADVENLQRLGYEKVGNWTLGQMCNHLAGSVNLTMSKPIQLIPRFLQRIAIQTFLSLAFLGKFGNAIGLRLPTSLPQKQPMDDTVGAQRLKESFDKLRQPNTSQLLDFHLWHCVHHLSFLIPRRDVDETT